MQADSYASIFKIMYGVTLFLGRLSVFLMAMSLFRSIDCRLYSDRLGGCT